MIKDFDLKRGKLAVVLIDMQTYFVKKLREGDAERIISNQIKILKHCCQFDIPVIAFELEPKRHGNMISEIAEIVNGNSNYELMVKRRYSAFWETNLDKRLKKLKIKKLFIMGINACYCVRETAEDAIERGYEIVTSNEVISGQTGHPKDNDIPWFSNNGSCIDSIGELIGV